MKKEKQFLLIFILGLIFYFLIAIYVNLPLQIQDKEFIIYSGEDLKNIALRLEKEKFIPSSNLFIILSRYYGKEKKFQPGIYYFPSNLSLKELIFFLSSNQSKNSMLTIKEGETLKEIEIKLKEENIIKNPITIYRLKNFFQDNLCLKEYFQEAEDNSLEGFLFPDTYHLPPSLKEEKILKITLNHFCEQFLDRNLKEKIEIFQKEFLKNYPNNKNYTPSFYDILKMASILEKEAKTKQEKQMVSDILWRRLINNYKLEVDASICYALSSQFKNCLLKREDFKIDSPFNTYLFLGLPPTPISNPSKESIETAVNPLKNNFWFYLSNKDGKTIFSENYQEHLRNREIFLLDN
jgi:UPF0755 protein